MIEVLKQHIKKFDYNFDYKINNTYVFKNENEISELQIFKVTMDYELERIMMWLEVDLGSFQEASEYSFDDAFIDILNGIKYWISKESRDEFKKGI